MGEVQNISPGTERARLFGARIFGSSQSSAAFIDVEMCCKAARLRYSHVPFSLFVPDLEENSSLSPINGDRMTVKFPLGNSRWMPSGSLDRLEPSFNRSYGCLRPEFEQQLPRYLASGR